MLYLSSVSTANIICSWHLYSLSASEKSSCLQDQQTHSAESTYSTLYARQSFSTIIKLASFCSCWQGLFLELFSFTFAIMIMSSFLRWQVSASLNGASSNNLVRITGERLTWQLLQWEKSLKRWICIWSTARHLQWLVVMPGKSCK